MKQTNLLMKTFLLCALLAGSLGAWAQKTTYDFTKGTAGTTPTLESSAHHKAGNSTNVFLATDAICDSKFCFQAVDNSNNVFNYKDSRLQQTKGDRWFSIVDLKAGDQIVLTFTTAAAGSSSGDFTIENAGTGSTTNLSTTSGGSAISAGTVVESGTSYYVLEDGCIDFKTRKNFYLTKVEISRPQTAPGAISFSPASGNVAEGSSVTLTSSNATTIEYKWGSVTFDGEGDWTGAETYSDNNKPVVPAVGSSNTVLSVKATNANGSTYGSASYMPVKMALKTIFSFADGIGSAEVTADNATIDDVTPKISITNTTGRVKLTAASGFEFKNGDAISFSGSIGNTSKKYGIKYGVTANLGTELYVAAGEPCYVSGTLTLASETSDLYIGRYDGTNTYITSFVIRRLVEAASEGITEVKIDGTAAIENTDYTIEGTTITLDGTFTTAPNVAFVNHIVFVDDSEEDQNLTVSFGNPDGEFYTGTVTIDGTTYTVKAPCGQINALKVEYKSGETLIKEELLDVTGLKVGASYTVPFRMYVEKDGALYQTTKNGSDPYYGDAVTLAYNTTVTKSLSTVDLGGGTIELFEDFDGDATQNANIRASNCSAYNNTAFTSTNDLPAGTYTFIVKAQNKGRGSSVKIGDQTVFSISDVNSATGSWTDKTLEDIVVPAAGKLTFVKGGSNTIDCYDILIAIRQLPASVSGTITASGYNTFSSIDPLDLSTISSGNTAYVATSIEGGKVILTKCTDMVPAGTGLFIAGTANSEFTINTTTGETSAPTGNMLVGMPKGGQVAMAGEGEYNYVFGWSEVSNPGFYLVNNTLPTLAANKAYLHTTEALTVAASRLSFVFENETTGVSTSLMNREEGAKAGEVYNLNGQRISQPTTGLYIVNGKKVIIK